MLGRSLLPVQSVICDLDENRDLGTVFQVVDEDPGIHLCDARLPVLRNTSMVV